MPWIDPDKASQHLKDVSSVAHTDTDLGDAINAAQDQATVYLRSAGFSSALMASWDTASSTTSQPGAPPHLQTIIGHIAAAFILRDFYGQLITASGDGKTKASDMYRWAMDELKAIAAGKTLLVDASSNSAPSAPARTFVSSATRSPVFTMGTDSESGTLDNL